MKEGPFKSALESTTKAMSTYLETCGFLSKPVVIKNGVTILRWYRDLGWKRDAVDIRYRNREMSVVVNVIVLLGTKLSPEEFCEFDGKALNAPIVPHLFHKLRSKLYARKVVRHLSREMNWFANYDSREKCLQMSTNQHRNGPRGGAVYTSALEKLNEDIQLIGGRQDG